MVIFRVYVNLLEGKSQSHGGFHSHGDTLMAGWFFMETHENKWMMTEATPILGNSNMLVILWTYATIRITLGIQNMYQYVRDPVTKSTCSLRYVYVFLVICLSILGGIAGYPILNTAHPVCKWLSHKHVVVQLATFDGELRLTHDITG